MTTQSRDNVPLYMDPFIYPGIVTPTGIIHFDNHWSTNGLSFSAKPLSKPILPIIVNCTFRNKLLSHCTWNSKLFVQGNSFELVCKMGDIFRPPFTNLGRPVWIKKNQHYSPTHRSTSAHRHLSFFSGISSGFVFWVVAMLPLWYCKDRVFGDA